MKIAVAGKGGVGKSTLSGALALLLSRRGERVLALDSDPDSNLASALGIPHSVQKDIVPISRQIELIEERTGSKVDQYGKVFKLNPDVSDVAGKFATRFGGVDLLVLGAVRTGGGGCACPENTFIRALVTDLVLYKRETLIMDMEAGIEHLGRATSRGVDLIIAVVEPGQRSVDCALTVRTMAAEIGISKFAVVGNKVTGPDDEAFIRAALPDAKVLGMLPYAESLRRADRDGVSVLDGQEQAVIDAFANILKAIEEM